MNAAFVFPGQGTSLVVGMGREVYDAFATAREVFQEVDDALNQKLTKLIFDGSESELALTQNAQPALMAVSIAILRVLEKESGRSLESMATLVAGHSLGEYTALCAAGTFSLADTARLLKIRGTAMQGAVPVGQGAMAALIGMDFQAVSDLVVDASSGDVCVVANDNAPGQVVVSGHAVAVDRALVLAAQRGVRKSVSLPVSAPFHCPLMQPAANAMERALKEVTLYRPVVPLMANVTAALTQDPVEIQKLLVQQVTGMVRWRESTLNMVAHGVKSLVEVGSGKVITGLTRRIAPDVACHNIGTPQEIDLFIKNL